MKKYNIPLHIKSKTNFLKMIDLIEKFMIDNGFKETNDFEAQKSRIFITKDRSKVIQLLGGLKKLGYTKFCPETLKYSLNQWVSSKCGESDMLEEMNAISLVWKGLTQSKKLAHVSYITIGMKNNKYIVTMNSKCIWRGYIGESWSEFDLSSSFTGSIYMAKAWSDTVYTLKHKMDLMEYEKNGAY